MMTAASPTYVIIPSYNEGPVIRSTVLPLIEQDYAVVVVDDASSDDTARVIGGLPVYYLRHRVNLGQGAAIQTGIEFCLRKGAEIMVTFDADGQHDPADIDGMIRQLHDERIHMVFGSRFLPGANTNIGLVRRFTLHAGRWINFLFTGILLTDAHNGLRVFDRHAAELISLKENRMAHASEFLLQVSQKKIKYAEYPIHLRYTEYSRKKGQSLLNSVRIFFEMVLHKIFD